jgi:hypothetical protein
VEFVNGEEKGTAITKGYNGYYRIPNTRHIIKLQWATCSSTIELDTIGLPVGEFKRQFDSRGETSLDVVVYDKNDTFNSDRFRQFSGTIPVESGKDSHTIDFVDEGVIINEKYDYSVKLATNQNFEAWVESKTNDELVVGWNRTPIRGEIDWIIIQENKTSGQQLATLNDENRTLNHFLFGSKIVDADFCGEYIIPPPDVDFFLDEDDDTGLREECECCDCCSDITTDDILIDFIIWGGSEIKPDEDSDGCEDCPYYSAQDSNGDVRYSLNPDDFRYEVIVDENVKDSNEEGDDELDEDFDEDDYDDLAGYGFGGVSISGAQETDDDDDTDDGVRGLIETARCLVSISGATSKRGKIEVDLNQEIEEGQYPSYFLSMDDVGIELETETYTNAEGGVSRRVQKYSCTVITVDSDSDVWVESYTEDGCTILWDPDFPPKYGIVYYNLKTTTFISPSDTVSVAIEPKKSVCTDDPGIVNTLGTGNLPIAIFSDDDTQGEILDNEPDYNTFLFTDNGDVVFADLNNWREEE